MPPVIHPRHRRGPTTLPLAFAALFTTALSSVAAMAAAPVLQSGTVTLSFPSGTGAAPGYGVLLTDAAVGGSPPAAAPTPVRIYTCPATGTAPAACTLYDGPASQALAATGYTAEPVVTGPDTVAATATVTTAGGSVVLVTDTWSTLPAPGAPALPSGSFRVARTVAVSSVGAGDTAAGLNSQFAMGLLPAAGEGATTAATYHILAPARWYDHNTFANPVGPASDPADWNGRTDFYWRETRTGAPLVLQQDPATGESFTLAHLSPTPTTTEGQGVRDTTWDIAAGAAYGAVGLAAAPAAGAAPAHVELGYMFPSEETLTIAPSGANDPYTHTWRGRSAPLAAGATENYVLLVAMNHATLAAPAPGSTDIADFPTALAQAFAAVATLYDVPFGSVDLHRAHEAALTNLADEFLTIPPPAGVAGPIAPGFAGNQENPFQPIDTANPQSFGMGFVGEQLPEAFQMYRHGVLHSVPAEITDGTAILNFWAAGEATKEGVVTAAGLPLISYAAQGVLPTFTPGFDAGACTPLYLRSLVDGMEAVEEAASLARMRHDRHAGFPAQPNWESFANGFAQFLLHAQGTDGTFPRAFTLAGAPFTAANLPASCTATADEATAVAAVDGASPLNTTFPIRFLAEMYTATGIGAYRTAAEAAGTWSTTNIYALSNYAGGTETVNKLDKEAGYEALTGAMALHDLAIANGAPPALAAEWLADATRAANYVTSWFYNFDYPINDETVAVANATRVVNDKDVYYGPEPAHRFANYVHAGTRASSFINSGNSSTDIQGSEAAYDLFRVAVLDAPSVPALANSSLLLNAARAETNTKLTTQLTDTPGDPQYFGYVHPGLVTEAEDLSNMGFYGTYAGAGWVEWLSSAELDNTPRFTATYGQPTIAEILRAAPDLTQLQEETANAYPRAGSVPGWAPLTQP